MEERPVILIMIGCFNPPTNGHLLAIAMAKDFMEGPSVGRKVKKCIMIPAHSGYKFKKGLLTGEERAEMCKAMSESVDFLEVSTFEIEKETWPRTIDTLDYMQKLNPECQIMIVCGIDLVEKFETDWRKPDVIRILEEYGLCVLPRNGEVADVKAKCSYAEGRDKNVYVLPENPLYLVSSTMIREMVEKGLHVSGLVSPAVEKIITTKGYYKE